MHLSDAPNGTRSSHDSAEHYYVMESSLKLEVVYSMEPQVDYLQNQLESRGLVGHRYPLEPHNTDSIHGPLVGLGQGVVHPKGPDGRLKPNGGIRP